MTSHHHTNESGQLLNVLDMLLRYHRHLGLSHEQYLLLHTCIQYHEMAAIQDITGFSEGKIVKMLKELMDQDLIVYHAQKGIEIEQLYEKLLEAEISVMPLRELLIREYKKDNRHIGHMEFVPMNEGIAVRMQNGKLLPLEKIRELTEELNRYIQSAMQEEYGQSGRLVHPEQRRKERTHITGTGRIKKVSRS